MHSPEAGSCCIKDSELVDAAYTSQLTYRLLQKRGAPIIGMCVLMINPQYRWFVHQNLKQACTEFRWEPMD